MYIILGTRTDNRDYIEANLDYFLFVMVPTVMPDVYEDHFRGL